MLVPIRCFTCGLSLGDLAPIYTFIRQKRMVALYGHPDATTAPTQAAVDPNQTKNIMGDVLEAFGVTKCCRTHLVTAMIFTEYY